MNVKRQPYDLPKHQERPGKERSFGGIIKLNPKDSTDVDFFPSIKLSS
jgi:hypothetical protein